MPVPVPAVAEMLRRTGAPTLLLGTETGELTTPTGCALVCGLADAFLGSGAAPTAGRILACGHGAGHKEIVFEATQSGTEFSGGSAPCLSHPPPIFKPMGKHHHRAQESKGGHHRTEEHREQSSHDQRHQQRGPTGSPLGGGFGRSLGHLDLDQGRWLQMSWRPVEHPGNWFSNGVPGGPADRTELPDALPEPDDGTEGQPGTTGR